MPLFKTITPRKGTKVFIWKVEESLEWLSEGISLTNHCAKRVDGMKSEIHRRGFMSIRHLMAEAGYVDQDLWYDDLGKPHLKDGLYISDGSMLPSAPGVNPQGSIMSLALRNNTRIIENL